jgi:hypothetical protein
MDFRRILSKSARNTEYTGVKKAEFHVNGIPFRWNSVDTQVKSVQYF